MSKLSVEVSAEDHCQGDEHAAVTLVEYADYQCPSCGDAFGVVKQLQKKYGKKLRFVFRNFPLEQHEFAQVAAEAAEYAATEGKFWEMHDALFEHQDEMDDDLFPTLAGDLGLKKAALKKALKDGEFAEKVEADMDGGEVSGVEGTPTFYINGEQHKGSYALESLEKAIDATLGK